MSQEIPNFILGTFVIGLFVGCCAGTLYAVLRWFEFKWNGIAYLMGGLAYAINLTVLYFGVVSEMEMSARQLNEPPSEVWPLIVLMGGVTQLALPWLSGWLHQKSGGASRNWWTAMLLMHALWNMNSALILWLGSAIHHNGNWFFIQGTQPLVLVFLAAMFLAPLLAPLGAWLWQSMRLRPGLDVPLNPQL